MSRPATTPGQKFSQPPFFPDSPPFWTSLSPPVFFASRNFCQFPWPLLVEILPRASFCPPPAHVYYSFLCHVRFRISLTENASGQECDFRYRPPRLLGKFPASSFFDEQGSTPLCCFLGLLQLPPMLASCAHSCVRFHILTSPPQSFPVRFEVLPYNVFNLCCFKKRSLP